MVVLDLQRGALLGGRVTDDGDAATYTLSLVGNCLAEFLCAGFVKQMRRSWFWVRCWF